MKPRLAFLFAHPAHLIALGYGAGLSPKAPGTAGSLLALPLFWLLMQLDASPAFLLSVSVAAFILGIWVCSVTGRHLGVADHGSIVWDEIVAVWFVLSLIAASWQNWLLAFALFRFFDILKPWPIRWFDARLKNGFGVMFDDILAALFTLLVLEGMQWLV